MLNTRLLPVILLFLLTAAPNEADVAEVVAPKRQWAQHPLGYKPEPGKGYLDLSIPAPIQPKEWSFYCDELMLSDAQRVAATALYEQYRANDWQLRQESAQPLWDASAEINARGDIAANVTTADDFIALLGKRDAVVREIESTEEGMFLELAEILAESQQLRLSGVQQMRVRMRCTAVPSPFSASTMDLQRVLAELHEGGVNVSPTNPEEFDRLLQSYSERATALFRAQSDVTMRNVRRIHALLAQANDPAHPVTAAQRDQLERERVRLSRENAANGKRIHILNRDFVSHCSAYLSESAAAALQKHFYQDAYPPIFPDPFDISEVLSAALSLSDLDAQQRSEVEAFQQAYLTTKNTIEQEMIAKYLDWHAKVVAEMTFDRSDYETYKEQMQRRQQSRRTNAESTLQALHAIVTVEQLEKPEQAIQRAQRSISTYDVRLEQMRARHQDWPPPW